MKHKQLPILFFCLLVNFINGAGIRAILPIYATDLGANGAMIGVYMALLSLTFAVGVMAVGWLTQFVPRHRLFVAAGLAGIPALLLHGAATMLWQAVTLSVIVFFCGAIGIALTHSLTAVLADKAHRGVIFSLMSISFPLAAFLGGLLVGPMVSGYGYAPTFVLLASLWACWPVTALLWLKVPSTVAAPDTVAQSSKSQKQMQVFDRRYWLLLLVMFLSSMVIAMLLLGIPLSMQQRHFSASAIVGTTTVAGLFTIPLALLYGRLSDRLGRRTILTWQFLLLVGSTLLLTVTSELWQFWLAGALVFATMYTSSPIARALVADIASADQTDRGISWLESLTSFAGMAGAILAGLLLDTLGTDALYGVATVFAIGAVTVLRLMPVATPVAESIVPTPSLTTDAASVPVN